MPMAPIRPRSFGLFALPLIHASYTLCRRIRCEIYRPLRPRNRHCLIAKCCTLDDDAGSGAHSRMLNAKRTFSAVTICAVSSLVSPPNARNDKILPMSFMRALRCRDELLLLSAIFLSAPARFARYYSRQRRGDDCHALRISPLWP